MDAVKPKKQQKPKKEKAVMGRPRRGLTQNEWDFVHAYARKNLTLKITAYDLALKDGMKEHEITKGVIDKWEARINAALHERFGEQITFFTFQKEFCRSRNIAKLEETMWEMALVDRHPKIQEILYKDHIAKLERLEKPQELKVEVKDDRLKIELLNGQAIDGEEVQKNLSKWFDQKGE